METEVHILVLISPPLAPVYRTSGEISPAHTLYLEVPLKHYLDISAGLTYSLIIGGIISTNFEAA
jgi:hypothetical protein